MKTVIFSDTHLTEKFVPNKYLILEKIVKSADRVIINGDFWDGYLTTYDKFYRSPWRKLLMLLKRKKTIYIFGNHDKESFLNKKKVFWSDCGWNYQFKEKGKTFHFEHGDRILPLWDNLFLNKPPKSLALITRYFVKELLFKTNKGLIMGIYKNFNKRLKEKYLKNKNGKINFFGHTHYPEFDLKNGYLNSGFIEGGFASYFFLKDGKINLFQFNY